MTAQPHQPLNAQQVAQLLKPINPKRVLHGGGQAHVPAYDVAAQLTRILGFGNWDTELLSKELLFESVEARERTKDGKVVIYNVWTVGYSATVRLIIKNEYGQEIAHWENGACGDAINQPSRSDAHHLAMTTAISTAMKRCAAFGLGDQFGLSLYNKGMTNALVGVTLIGSFEGVNDVQDSSPTPLSMGNDEKQTGEVDPLAQLGEAFRALKMDRAAQKKYVEDVLEHPVAKMSDLDSLEALRVVAYLAAEVAGSEGLTPDEV